MEVDWNNIYAAIWRQQKLRLRPGNSIDPILLNSLVGIDSQKEELVRNTERFLANKPANNHCCGVPEAQESLHLSKQF